MPDGTGGANAPSWHKTRWQISASSVLPGAPVGHGPDSGQLLRITLQTTQTKKCVDKTT